MKDTMRTKKEAVPRTFWLGLQRTRMRPTQEAMAQRKTIFQDCAEGRQRFGTRYLHKINLKEHDGP